MPGAENLRPGKGKTVIDIHVHAAGAGFGRSGCFIGKTLLRSWKFPWYLRGFGLSPGELASRGDRASVEAIAGLVTDSSRVAAAVVLALDGVISGGRLDTGRTQLFVPNDFVHRETGRHDCLLFGASVNPYRRDACEILKEQVARGAVLVKWIPSIQGIDPSDPGIDGFYETLAGLGIPLLTHTGHERALPGSREGLADPALLERALGAGVTVIAAHASIPGMYGGEDGLGRLTRLMAVYPNLFADLSSLTQINKPGGLAKALSSSCLAGRLVHGSDFPLIATPLVSPWHHILTIGPFEARRIASISNAFDRDLALKESLGTPGEVFEHPIAGQMLLHSRKKRV